MAYVASRANTATVVEQGEPSVSKVALHYSCLWCYSSMDKEIDAARSEVKQNYTTNIDIDIDIDI